MRYNFDKFDFVGKSKYFYMFSIAITVLGILVLAIGGLNYGVDFRAGSSMDIAVSENLQPRQDEIRALIDKEELGRYNLTVGTDRVTIRFDDILTDKEENKLKTDFAAAFDPTASAEVNTVDVQIAREIQTKAMLAVLIASLGIIVYVSIRFEWRFALASIVALLHDAFIVISVFSILQLEVNIPFVVAILTIIGYSINDTIVIFDRIRENLRFAKIKGKADLVKLVNESVSQTMTRSINTVVTVLFAALSVFVFGGESIRLFSLAMVIGLVAGAYSSIFIASPLWLLMKSKEKPKTPAAKSQSAV
ncbi:protein translocase subunit SecF [uncultured Paenibacillus sp.]|uniref:protein translocase subunit SecF n=1 Tax=uncultured Paenibacillus sp. TaxID=227322 RepID=UPI0028D82558|nr:protein translocase subunit SecF [uncultured Paenibacillus sp.]